MTTVMPEAPPTPLAWIVYDPGDRVVSSAASRDPGASGNAPHFAAAAFIAAVSSTVPPAQLSFSATIRPVLSKSTILGSESAPVTRNEARVGPTPRISACREPAPMLKPAIRVSSPEPTRPRTARLIRPLP